MKREFIGVDAISNLSDILLEPKSKKVLFGNWEKSYYSSGIYKKLMRACME